VREEIDTDGIRVPKRAHAGIATVRALIQKHALGAIRTALGCTPNA
jgi:hypothetical protein